MAPIEDDEIRGEEDFAVRQFVGRQPMGQDQSVEQHIGAGQDAVGRRPQVVGREHLVDHRLAEILLEHAVVSQLVQHRHGVQLP